MQLLEFDFSVFVFFFLRRAEKTEVLSDDLLQVNIPQLLFNLLDLDSHLQNYTGLVILQIDTLEILLDTF